jgi:alpha-1,2-mannosyltransferase/arabinofuranan 3-O-arabinosyltransferase
MLVVVKFRKFGSLLKTPADITIMVAAVIALGTAVALYASFGFGVLASIADGSIDSHFDFNVFWHSANALWDGRSIYVGTGGPDSSANPPIWTLLISPLGLLEPITAYRLFVVLTLPVTIGYLVWTASELGMHARWALMGGCALLLSLPMLGTLALGQMYPLLTLGLVAAWAAHRRDKPDLSGVALGLVVAVKPLLAPVLLWPLVLKKWQMFATAVLTGSAASLVADIIVGPGATLEWLLYVGARRPDGYWDNNTIPGAAARIFAENNFVEPIILLPWALPVAYALGIGTVILTAVVVRRDPEMGLWALVAASLLASPIAWHNYLVLLGPAALLLLARGWVAQACLLLALQLIPPDWSVPWRYGEAPWASLALTFYLYVLIVHWLVLLTASRRERPVV